jgi:aspartyl-tRNA synthetase
VVGASPGDCVFFAAGDPRDARALLGAARVEIGRRCGLIDESAWSFVWVVDAPLFKPTEGSGDVAIGHSGWTAVHHPFTAPTPQWAQRFDQDPGLALSCSYDLVCNGHEIGGGSIRIHQPDVQQQVFSVLGISEDQAREKFGFLLEAFRYGPPPHGGIAFGWDRICMLLADADSLREVIAFPKSGGGLDPLTGAPAPITPQQRAEAGVDVTPPARH